MSTDYCDSYYDWPREEEDGGALVTDVPDEPRSLSAQQLRLCWDTTKDPTVRQDILLLASNLQKPEVLWDLALEAAEEDKAFKRLLGELAVYLTAMGRPHLLSFYDSSVYAYALPGWSEVVQKTLFALASQYRWNEAGSLLDLLPPRAVADQVDLRDVWCASVSETYYLEALAPFLRVFYPGWWWFLPIGHLNRFLMLCNSPCVRDAVLSALERQLLTKSGKPRSRPLSTETCAGSTKVLQRLSRMKAADTDPVRRRRATKLHRVLSRAKQNLRY